jgi:hypothetical protein
MVPPYATICLGLLLGAAYGSPALTGGLGLGLELPPAIVAYHARLPDVIMGEAVVLWLAMVVSGRGGWVRAGGRGWGAVGLGGEAGASKSGAGRKGGKREAYHVAHAGS